MVKKIITEEELIEALYKNLKQSYPDCKKIIKEEVENIKNNKLSSNIIRMWIKKDVEKYLELKRNLDSSQSLMMKQINEILSNLSPKKVLDIGIGDGIRSNRYLEKSEITGLDTKKVELDKRINFFNCNICDFIFKEKYDLIIASAVLHFLEKEKAIEIIKKIKDNTSVDGYNFLVLMSGFEPHNEKYFYPSKEFISDLYRDWSIKRIYEMETQKHKHPNTKEHFHKLIVLLAKNEVKK